MPRKRGIDQLRCGPSVQALSLGNAGSPLCAVAHKAGDDGGM
jgi:hypothetical protein